MSQGQRPAGAQASANEIFSAAVDERVERQRVSVETAKKQAPITRERVVILSLGITAPIFLGAIAVNVFGLSPRALFDVPPSPAAARLDAQRALDALVADIESYRKDYKQLPTSLVELGPRPKGTWTYTTVGSTYRLQGTLHGQQVSFDGVTPKPRSAKERE